MTLGMAFEHFSRNKKIGWTPDDPYWRDNFTLTKKTAKLLMTPQERHANKTPKPTYTIPKLAQVYAVARPYERMLILCGVTLGWTQGEFNTFLKEQCNCLASYEPPANSSGRC